MLEIRGSSVRLDNATFAAVVHGAHPEVLSIPGMAEGLAAVRRPLVEVDAWACRRDDVVRHHVWLRRQVAMVLLTVSGETRQLMAVPAAHVPSGLARALRWLPREAAESGRAKVERDHLDTLFGDDPAVRTAAFDDLDAEVAWSVVSRWSGGERRMLVLDSPAHGQRLARPSPADLHWELVPASSTTLWRRLASLLPHPDQLEER